MLELGDYSYGDIKINGNGLVKVGKFCSIASEVEAWFLDQHRSDWITAYPFPPMWEETRSIKGHPDPNAPKEITIHNDVWIGRRAIILGGAEIESGAVVGAFSVVGGRVPAYSVVVGNPAKVTKMRFTQEQIEELLSIKWWDWPKELIVQYSPTLCSPNIDEFINTRR